MHDHGYSTTDVRELVRIGEDGELEVFTHSPSEAGFDICLICGYVDGAPIEPGTDPTFCPRAWSHISAGA